jgi:secondary thiamine-phosphate synthase enzyme
MVYREEVKVQSNSHICTFHNVTEQTKRIVECSKIRNGIVVVYSHHTTCSVIIQECAFDMSMTGLETLQQDFVDVFDAIVPVCRTEGLYLHPGKKALSFAADHGEDARGCHNTDAHLRSALVGRSESIALIDGAMDLGDYGFIYFVDFDQTRGRERTIQVTVVGDR